MARFALNLVCCLVLLSFACSRPPQPLQDLGGHEDLSAYMLTLVRGQRDGDILDAHASYSDGPSALMVDLRFTIGSPTQLSSGRWKWSRKGHLSTGSVAARSVMFLGGQNGPPSLGGLYDLLDSAGVPAYRIFIPTTELEVRAPAAPR